MSDESSDVVMKQVWLGLKPFVLLEIKSVEFDDDGAVTGLDVSTQFGGGVDEDFLPDLLEMALDALKRDAVASTSPVGGSSND